MRWPDFILFASDATLAAPWGGALLALAALALVAERRRARRRRPDAVGWVPWTALFLACALGGVALLTLAEQAPQSHPSSFFPASCHPPEHYIEHEDRKWSVAFTIS